VSVQVSGGSLQIWVAKSQAHMMLRRGDWAAIERDGSGVYPITEADQADGYEPVEVPQTLTDALGLTPGQVQAHQSRLARDFEAIRAAERGVYDPDAPAPLADMPEDEAAAFMEAVSPVAGKPTLWERIAALADQWEREAEEWRAQSVRDGLHPALASAHREANLLRQRAADLRELLAVAGAGE
jgi:hypothetical protein